MGVRTDETWGIILDEIEIQRDAPVVVRTTGQGVVAGRLRAAAGSIVGLVEVTQLWRWEGTGGPGSIHDLLGSLDTATIRRCEHRPRLVVTGVHSIDPITEDQFEKIRNANT